MRQCFGTRLAVAKRSLRKRGITAAVRQPPGGPAPWRVEGNPYTELAFRKPDATAIPNAPPPLHPDLHNYMWN